MTQRNLKQVSLPGRHIERLVSERVVVKAVSSRRQAAPCLRLEHVVAGGLPDQCRQLRRPPAIRRVRGPGVWPPGSIVCAHG